MTAQIPFTVRTDGECHECEEWPVPSITFHLTPEKDSKSLCANCIVSELSKMQWPIIDLNCILNCSHEGSVEIHD